MTERFAKTRWSLVIRARKPDTTEARRALATLCEAYWYPLYGFVRRRGHPPDEAADLLQGYFVKLLDKGYLGDVEPYGGRFRAFLLSSVKNYLANERARAGTLKRGGHLRMLSLDDRDAESRYRLEPADLQTPEALYERRWATTVLEQALSRLEAELAEEGREARFAELQRFLIAGEEASYSDAAAALGISEGAVRVAVHRLRKRYGALLRAEIADTVADPAEVESEVRYLVSILREAGHSPT